MKARVLQALTDCHLVSGREFSVISQNFWQPVERYAAIEVMYVVDADVRAKPLQYGWQNIVRAAVQCCIMQIPIFLVVPVRFFKLVLNVEQPYTSSRRQKGRGNED